jgi:hypothetical protein
MNETGVHARWRGMTFLLHVEPESMSLLHIIFLRQDLPIITIHQPLLAKKLQGLTEPMTPPVL